MYTVYKDEESDMHNTIKEYPPKKLLINRIIRRINVYVGDMTKTDKHYDLVLCSAFKNCYEPVGKSFIQSLYSYGVDVSKLAKDPKRNGKDFGFWISRSKWLRENNKFFDRLCCFEFKPPKAKDGKNIYSRDINFRAIFDYFITMLKYDNEFHFRSIATPLLGTNNVGLSQDQIIPIMLETALQCFMNNNELEEFSIYCLEESTAKKITNKLNNILRKPYDVFISYPHTKKNEMLVINELLEKHSLLTWNDEKFLKIGDKFDDDIANAIDGSKSFFVLWYEDTEESEYCNKELEYALDLNKKVMAYRCSDKLNGKTAIGQKIGRRNWYTKSERNYEELVKSIKTVLDGLEEENNNVKIIEEN